MNEVGQNQLEQPPRFQIVDRRRSSRFALGLAVQCRCMEGDPERTVPGEVVNISSKGLLIKTAKGALLSGQMVTASIDWPAHLDKRVQLRLVVEGEVVRSTDDLVAIHIERYEFRTRGMAGIATESPVAPKWP